MGCKTWSNQTRKDGFGRMNPQKVLPWHCFSIQRAHSLNRFTSCEEILSLGELSDIQSNNQHTDWHFMIHRMFSPTLFITTTLWCRQKRVWVQRDPALSSGSRRKSATVSCVCAPMCVGSVAASEQTAGVWWAGSRPGIQNFIVPFFVLEKDHPRNGPESQSSKGRWQWLEKAKQVGLASQGARYDINFLHVWWD